MLPGSGEGAYSGPVPLSEMRNLGLVCAAFALAAPAACNVDYEANQDEYDEKRCARTPALPECLGQGGDGGGGGSAGTLGKGGVGGTSKGGSSGSAGDGASAGVGDGGTTDVGGAGGFDSGPCVEPDVRCNPEGNAETCSGDQWVETVCSGATPECEAGVCVECVTDSVRCNDSTPELCVSNAWQAQTACAGNQICQGGGCVTPPSCSGLASTCGPSESCCNSSLVPGVASGIVFYRNNNGTLPATVSDFMLDRYEVTVGRFRKFLAAYPANMPVAGDGAHPNIPDSGWQATWDIYLQPSAASLEAALACDAFATFTPTASTNENKPINCVDWYTAFAFCAWDGGFLPTDLEWNYAAAGGDDQRSYPWGSTVPPANTSYAIYDCLYGGGGPCNGPDRIAPVGSATSGVGKWGHLDLSGNIEEWNLDNYASYPAECDDCADLTDSGVRVKRAGYFNSVASTLLTTYRNSGSLASSSGGLRCARAP